MLYIWRGDESSHQRDVNSSCLARLWRFAVMESARSHRGSGLFSKNGINRKYHISFYSMLPQGSEFSDRKRSVRGSRTGLRARLLDSRGISQQSI